MNLPRRVVLFAAITGALSSSTPFARGAEPATVPSASSSFLHQVSDESQKLFESIRPGLVGVTLPPPLWVKAILEQNNPMKKWGDQLNPDLRKQFDNQGSQKQFGAAIAPTSQ